MRDDSANEGKGGPFMRWLFLPVVECNSKDMCVRQVAEDGWQFLAASSARLHLASKCQCEDETERKNFPHITLTDYGSRRKNRQKFGKIQKFRTRKNSISSV